MFKLFLPFLIGACFFLSSATADDIAPWDRDDGFYDTGKKEQDASCYEPCQTAGVCEEITDEECVFEEGTPDEKYAFEEEAADGELVFPQEVPQFPPEYQTEEVAEAAPPLQTLGHVIRRHAEQLEKITRLHWYGSKGINQPLANHITITYECYHALTVEQARKLFVYATETLLKAINSLGPDHPQLGHHPFTPNNLEIVIRFDNFFGQYVDRQYVKLLRMRGELVEYYSYSCGQEGKNCCRRRERYRDSVDAVKLHLEYADRFQRIKDRRTFGILIDDAFPFTGVFE